MKKMSLAGPLFVAFIFILLLPAALVFLSLNAMTPPDGGTLTDCVVTQYIRVGKQATVNVDYVNSAGKTINANISNGVGSKSAFVGQHIDCYVYDSNPFEVYRKPDPLEGKLLYIGAGLSALLGIIIVALLLKKRSKQGFLIKNGQLAQGVITDMVVKQDSSGFTNYICDYTFTDSSGQVHMGKHTFMNKRVSVGNTFPVYYASKGGKIISDIAEE